MKDQPKTGRHSTRRGGKKAVEPVQARPADTLAALALPQHEIRRLSLSQLQPSGYNPRMITPEALAGLSASLERFGCVQPIVWNEQTGHVVGGHQRLAILAARGVAEADCVVVNLPPAEEKALNLALNSPALQGEFTPEIAALLDELQQTAPDLGRALLLEDLRAIALLPSDAEGREYDESIADEVKMLTCPKCGHEFPS